MALAGLKRIAIRTLIAAVLIYVAIVGLLYTFQRRLIYPGWYFGTAAVNPDRTGYRDVAITTSDGLRGRLLYHPPQQGKPVILFFHGNGDSVLGSIVAMRSLVAAGYGAVLPEFRGFNGAPGIPDEQGLYRDARAARAWMTANGIGADRIVIIGYSLGTGVAAQMALEHAPRALILVAPYASVAHVAAARFWWLPADLLVSERFDTAAKIGRIACPILLLHGTADTTIPPENSASLKALRPNADRVVFPRVGHEVVFSQPAQALIARWLNAHSL
ncbi:alpha/beta fold hydrolase [Sphingomonas sp.]|uniref:alpha/beta hydrolase n=1 Tax=Sphingomonas sp. TaxID=28214 RepID=UPI0025D5CA90|nr:alpha/beta fold hydrolase [Sphingomonas sp.]